VTISRLRTSRVLRGDGCNGNPPLLAVIVSAAGASLWSLECPTQIHRVRLTETAIPRSRSRHQRSDSDHTGRRRGGQIHSFLSREYQGRIQRVSASAEIEVDCRTYIPRRYSRETNISGTIGSRILRGKERRVVMAVRGEERGKQARSADRCGPRSRHRNEALPGCP